MLVVMLGQRGMCIQSANAEDDENSKECSGATVARDHAADWCEARHSSHPKPVFGYPASPAEAGSSVAHEPADATISSAVRSS
jgi:hypothetical protein